MNAASPSTASGTTGSGKVRLDQAQRAEVRPDRVAGRGEQVPGAGARADDVAGPDRPAVRPGPVQHPGQAGDRVAHRGAALARLDVVAVEGRVHLRSGQVEVAPGTRLGPAHERGAATVVQARAV